MLKMQDPKNDLWCRGGPELHMSPIWCFQELATLILDVWVKLVIALDWKSDVTSRYVQ